jgi:SpoVK/Ycf46/Vps4 family AAA+-type ATPase
LYASLDLLLGIVRKRQINKLEDKSTAEDDVMQFLVIRNADRYIYPQGPQGPVDSTILGQLQKLIYEGQAVCVFVLLQVTPGFKIPPELIEHMEYIDHKAPDKQEREQLIKSLGISEVTEDILTATAGLSRTKTVQYVADSMAQHQSVDSKFVFLKKAKHIANASKVTVWSPEFETNPDDYNLNNIVGLEGVKTYLKHALRSGVHDRAKLKHILLFGIPGTGKTYLGRCLAGEYGQSLSLLEASKMHDKWHGDSEKNLEQMLSIAGQIGGFILFDEFHLMFGNNKNMDSSSGVEQRVLGGFQTWLNDQRTNVVISTANDITNLPDALLRSNRVDATFFVGLPGREAKDAAWKMYMAKHELENQEIPNDDYWTPSDISVCCKNAEMLGLPLVQAQNYVPISYNRSPEDMEKFWTYAERNSVICAETGKPFKRNSVEAAVKIATPTKVTRKVRSSRE